MTRQPDPDRGGGAGRVVRLPGVPLEVDLVLPPITLEGGARLRHHLVRGWHWGPAEDGPVLAGRGARPAPAAAARRVVSRAAAELTAAVRVAPRIGTRLSPAIPTVVVVHALTGDARAGGDGGWWQPLIGPGRAFDPARVRVLCFNLLGSCYGSSGPADGGFPRLADDRFPAELAPERGGFPVPAVDLPATVTTWDQARSILLALDALGVERVELITGGSLGAMVALAAAALDPDRFARLAPIAGAAAASSWILAWNHVARQTILADPGFPDQVGRGLELARQLAMITYRAEPGLDHTQGRRQTGAGRAPDDHHRDRRDHPDGDGRDRGWSSRRRYRVQTYLEHQGHRLRDRFDARAYLALLGAMDHHDLARRPPPPEGVESWPAQVGPPPAAFAALAQGPRQPRAPSWGLDRIRATTVAVAIDSDTLYLPEHGHALTRELAARGIAARTELLRSPHGHDGFLIEWDQLDALVRGALAAPAGRGRWDPRRADLPGVVGGGRYTVGA